MAAETPMARMLAVLNGAEIGRRLGVSRNAVGEDEEAAWPEWARRLDAKLDRLLASADDPIADALHVEEVGTRGTRRIGRD